MEKVIQLGIDILQEQDFAPLIGKRVGLFTNASGVDSCLRATYDILWQASEVNLVALFAPEHGIAAAMPDGEHINDMIDPRTGIRVFSLYGDTYAPTEDMMRHVDVIVVDIQDIGVRYYTFMWSMTYVLEACGQFGVEMLILDRPNPLGEWLTYPILDSSISTLVGRFPVPIQHSMTIGEMAKMVNGEWLEQPAQLEIIKCKNYDHQAEWQDLPLMWVPPSPNMPHLSTVRNYIGSCLIEGTNLSEGRGTPLPFEVIGAPWIDKYKLADEINALPEVSELDVFARPHSFKPTASKFNGQVCHGIQIHFDEYELFDCLGLWLTIIDNIRHTYPDRFEWISPPEPDGIYHFDRLIGIPNFHEADNLVETLDKKKSSDEKMKFTKLCKPYMLYK